jgi:hypothetical protein
MPVVTTYKLPSPGLPTSDTIVKLLLAIVVVFSSCVIHPEEKAQELPPETNHLDSIKAQSKIAYIVFHHQIQKMSLVAKQYHDRREIDSLFTYVGQLSNDTSCLKGGLFNYFGQINLCKDSSLSDPIAELHFVLEGNCEGIYLQTGNYLERYELTAPGKKFLLELYEPFKKQLK